MGTALPLGLESSIFPGVSAIQVRNPLGLGSLASLLHRVQQVAMLVVAVNQ